MLDTFFTQDYPTKVNVILCLLSFLLAVISVVTVVITLRQNHKMISNSTRPYVTASAQVTNFQNAKFYVLIKNFGTSGAVIRNIKPDIDIKKYLYSETTPFDFAKNLFLAPGQSICVEVDSIKMHEDGIHLFEFNIDYNDVNHANKKKIQYSEQFPINYDCYSRIALSRASTKDKELRTISFALQDLVEKIM